MVIIPITPSVPHFTVEVELDGSTFSLEFLWNGRAQAWFVSLFDAAGDLLSAGRRVVLDWPIFVRVRDPRAPKGVLLATDTTGKGLEAGLDDLGARVRISFETFAGLST